MGLLSFLQRRTPSSSAAPLAAEDDVAAARTRARRRLMGAAVLVLIGVVGFPLVFETQPRPIPVDIPIEIPRKDAAPVLAMPPARKPAASPAPASAPAAAPREPLVTETAADAGKEVAAARPASAPAAQNAPASAPDPVRRPVAAAAARVPSAPTDGARARALLEGKDGPAPASPTAVKADAAGETGRFVVQVGAFADAAAARETRSKVEKLGLKSYTQVVETSSGSRIRVRAGPFGSRDEADKALAKAKAAGLNAVVLTL